MRKSLEVRIMNWETMDIRSLVTQPQEVSSGSIACCYGTKLLDRGHQNSNNSFYYIPVLYANLCFFFVTKERRTGERSTESSFPHLRDR